jgi:hypothetical protein
MSGRSVQGLSKPTDIAWFSLGKQLMGTRARPRRTLAAFLTGAGLLGLGLTSLQTGVAAGLVNASNSPIAFMLGRANDRAVSAASDRATTNIVWTSLDPDIRPKRKAGIVTVAAVQGPTSLPRRSVCVRLCDGYFFPLGPLSRAGDLANHEAACSGLCPDAPTEVFIEPAGSDKIEDAVSSDGAPYTALPVAFRNRTVADNTCSCHKRAGATFSLRDDFTLRKGDSVMTASGFMVFRGAARMPLKREDFATLANASMPKEKRTVLAAMERASLPGLRESNAVFLAASNARIAFAAPPAAPSSLNKKIRFVERGISQSN